MDFELPTQQPPPRHLRILTGIAVSLVGAGIYSFPYWSRAALPPLVTTAAAPLAPAPESLAAIALSPAEPSTLFHAIAFESRVTTDTRTPRAKPRTLLHFVTDCRKAAPGAF